MKAAISAIALVAWSLPVADAAPLPDSNPLAAAAALPYQVPPFDRVKDADFQPALEAGMDAEMAEIQAIANDPAAPTFDNTIAAMERTGALLNRARTLFQALVASNTDPTLDKVNLDEAPRLQAHADAILLNPKLFQRIRTLYDGRAGLGLDPKQAFLLERTYTHFVRAGARLGDADKQKLRALNDEIAKLETEFVNQLRIASADAGVVVSDKRELDGLSDAEIAAAASAATARKLDGKYLIVLANTTQQPILASLKNRALRAKIMAASETRGTKPGPTDERDRVVNLAKLRAQKAKLLGYPTFAAYVIDDQMAKNPGAASKLLNDLVPAAVAKANEEAAEIQQLIDQQKGGFKLAASDWAFYAGQVKKAKYDVDDAEVKQYFELDRVLNDGVFFAANQLYGLTFKPRPDLPIYQPDVKAYEVFDKDGASLALFYTDYFARPNKNGGAWCTLFNNPSGLAGVKPILVNNLNIQKPPAGQKVLLTFDEVTTLFHEFGHALHGMFSVQYYASENGFNVPRDVIEFPSQFNEHWALDATVLAHYAHHQETGAPIPAALVDKIKRARSYGQGYGFTEKLAAMLLDLDWHSLSADAPSQIPDLFERASLKKNKIDLATVPPRYHTPYFLHIWGNGYQANYYSYLWGEVLDDDTYEWFGEHGGLTRENGQKFRDGMLGPGYTADPMALYRAFRGRDPSVEAVKRDRDLTAEVPAAKP